MINICFNLKRSWFIIIVCTLSSTGGSGGWPRCRSVPPSSSTTRPVVTSSDTIPDVGWSAKRTTDHVLPVSPATLVDGGHC